MPRKKQYIVKLSDEQRDRLEVLIGKGQAKARVLRRAYTLLLADEDKTDAMVAECLKCTTLTVLNIRKKFVQQGFEAALYDKPRPGAQKKLEPKQEAHLIALACSEAPEGRERWSVRLLAERFVEQGHVDEISRETVRRTLKKMLSNPGRKNNGVSVP